MLLAFFRGGTVGWNTSISPWGGHILLKAWNPDWRLRECFIWLFILLNVNGDDGVGGHTGGDDGVVMTGWRAMTGWCQTGVIFLLAPVLRPAKSRWRTLWRWMCWSPWRIWDAGTRGGCVSFRENVKTKMAGEYKCAWMIKLSINITATRCWTNY